MTPMLTTLSPEILHGVCLNVDPSDLAALATTCRVLNGFIQRDDLLWKVQYLSRFNEPSSSQYLEVTSWKSRLQHVVSVQKIFESDDQDLKRESEKLEQVCHLVFDLMTASESHPIKNMLYLNDLFATELNISSFLCRSSLFRHARFPADQPASTEALRQLSAKLHVYYGLEVEPSAESLCESAREHTLHNAVRQVHPYARSRVYDLRRYRNSNIWGPFYDDGSLRVDWEKIQSIMIILCYNLRMYTERRQPSSSLNSPASTSTVSSNSTSTSTNSPTSSTSSSSSSTLSTSNQLWDHPFQGLAPNSYTSYSLSGKIAPPLHPDLDVLDPYGVTGTWMRIVCFLDYNDLYAFNFESGWIPPTQERDPIEMGEAFRLIRLQLHVTKIEMPDEEGGYWEFEAMGHGTPAAGVKEGREILKRAERENQEWKKMPIVHFEGRSKSTYMAWDPNANSRIRGTVRTTPHNSIHWTTFSIFHGEERWRSEGVQIGGIRSARGILGNWFDKDYDVHGPAGPTAFWKVSDDVVEDRPVVGPFGGVGMGGLGGAGAGAGGGGGSLLWGVLGSYDTGVSVLDGDVGGNANGEAGED